MSVCSGCGYKDYINHKVGVNVVIRDKGNILLIKRAIEPNKGSYDLPGGFLDIDDENIEQACYREVQEEVGLTDSDLGDMVYFGSGTEYYNWMDTQLHIMCCFFITELKSDRSTINLAIDESQDALWVKSSGLTDINLAWNIDKRMLAKYFSTTKGEV